MSISPINLGSTFTNSNGTTVTGGLSSGLDTSTIINSLVSAQTAQVTKLQDNVTIDNNKTTALSTLNQLLTSLESSTEALASPNSPDLTTNVFAQRTSTVTGNTSSAASNFITATASTLAAAGNYTISNVTQIARPTIQESSGFSIASADSSVVTSTATAGQFTAGTFTINGQSITLTAGESLNQVAAAFNTANSGTNATGISASVLQTSSGVFNLVFTGVNTGVANAFNINSTVSTNTVAVASADAATSGQFAAGTYTVNGQSVTLTSNESLNDIAAAFNSAGAGITATVANTGTGQYQINFTGEVAGLSSNSSNFDLVTPSSNTISIADADTATNGQFAAGTYSINGATVTLTANETLNQVAASFNAANSGATPSGVTATVVNTGSGQYQIQFTGNTSALNNSASKLDLNTSTLATVTNDTSGVLANVSLSTVQTAQDAKFTFNGIAIDRATNNVSDLVTGVTFNLLQNTLTQPDASFTVAVTPDTSAITDAVQSFVNDYNNFLVFYSQQTQYDTITGAPATTAYLNADNTLNSIYNQLSTFAAAVVSGVASGNSTLQDIGISFANQAATSTAPAVNNYLSINTTTLNNAITNNLSGLESVFGYNTTSSSSNLEVFSGPVDQTVSNFTINIDPTQTPPVYQAVYTKNGSQQTVNLTASTLADGISLTAPASSGLNGLVLIYAGSTSQAVTGITVSATNGIASMMKALATTATTPNTGLIATDQAAVKTDATTLQTQITNVNTQITTQRQQLLTKFSALEAAIASANSSLNFLNAQQLAQSSSS